MIISAHACMMNITMTVVFEINMIIVLKIELNIVIHNTIPGLQRDHASRRETTEGGSKLQLYPSYTPVDQVPHHAAHG